MLFNILLNDFIFISLSLFFLGLCGIVLGRKNIIIMLMSIELMLLAVNLNLLFFSVYIDDIIGQLFALLVLTVAAAEAAIGLAILVIYFRIRGTILVQYIHFIKG
jgi:NADH-quinone oxidoreductase subunit K